MKKTVNFEDVIDEHELKIKNIEALTKIKTKCNDFFENETKVLPSAIVNYLMKGIKIISRLFTF